MTLRSLGRWPVVGAALVVVAVVVALVIVAIDSDGDDEVTTATTSAPTGTATTADRDAGGTASAPATTAPPTTSEEPADGSGGSPEDVASARYGAAYVGDCSSVPPPGDVGADSLCSLSVSLSGTEVALLVGPPYSEFTEGLLARLEAGAWSLADSYTFPPLGEEDPAEPDWVGTALEMKD